MKGVENTLIEPPVVGVKPEEADFPGPLSTFDDAAPVLVITHVLRAANGRMIVRGSAADGDGVKSVGVNGRSARPLRRMGSHACGRRRAYQRVGRPSGGCCGQRGRP